MFGEKIRGGGGGEGPVGTRRRPMARSPRRTLRRPNIEKKGTWASPATAARKAAFLPVSRRADSGRSRCGMRRRAFVTCRMAQESRTICSASSFAFVDPPGDVSLKAEITCLRSAISARASSGRKEARVGSANSPRPVRVEHERARPTGTDRRAPKADEQVLPQGGGPSFWRAATGR